MPTIAIHDGLPTDDPLVALEAAFDAQEANNLPCARAALRKWLFDRTADPSLEGSIGDALQALNRSGKADRTVAIVLIRALSIDGLMPEPNSANQIARLVSEICESKLPEVCEFIGIKARAQSFEKFTALCAAHDTISNLLSILTEKVGDLNALISAKRRILGALNHSIVRSYCRPFRLQELKGGVEVLISRLERLSRVESTFLQDYEDCQRAIEDLRRSIAEHPSFLSRRFLDISISADFALKAHLNSVRSKYVARIIKKWEGVDLPRHYPLHEERRTFQIAVPMRNEGTGLALDVRVSAVTSGDDIIVTNQSLVLGNVQPGDFSIVFDATVARPTSHFSGLMEVQWTEIGNPETHSVFIDFEIRAQDPSIDWPALEYSSPYNTNVAVGENFFGRSSLIRTLAGKLLRDPMEPFYITGQRRVGKTSLALALVEFAKRQRPPNVLHHHYVLWGDVAHSDPKSSLRMLGQSIEAFIYGNLPKDVVSVPMDYDGSLAPLAAITDLALRACPDQKFAIIIDEFDDIPQELFLHGNLADTFFANLRSLSRRKNVSVILVGGENMPFIMDRQGQKLNNFTRHNLSYFSRESDWSDFQDIVRKPTEGALTWHDDAISEIFNISNGNPYFAKIVCAGAMRSAIAERDADITSEEVRLATDKEISSLGTNSFAHLWQDGIPRPNDEREPDVLRRSRVLVAAARCLRHSKPLTSTSINESKASASLTEAEVVAVINDFGQRNVLKENGGVFSFVLPIFARWLVDIGAQHLIADSLSEELADVVLREENEAVVRAQEVVELVSGWPTYRGRHIGADDVRSWLQQVSSLRDQRALFRLLQRTKVYSEAHVRERLRHAFEIMRPNLDAFIVRSRNQKRDDIVIVYVDGEGKSGAYYASLFAEENRISASCVMSARRFNEYMQNDGQPRPVQAVVIMDDIAATGNTLATKFAEFHEANRLYLENKKVFVVTVVATRRACELLSSHLSEYMDCQAQFRTCEVLSPSQFALPDDKTGFSSEDEWERARALCVDYGAAVDRRRPLGYGGMGLLVVFPTNTPNNTLPILRSYSRSATGKSWRPLFERVVH